MPRITALACLVVCSCAGPAPAEPRPVEHADEKPAPSPESFVFDRRFETELLAAAAEYSAWGYVDEQPNVAPELCWMPTGIFSHSCAARDFGMPARARLSEAGPHGQKLYYLAAKDRASYLGLGGADANVGQVVVKEAWTAVDAPVDATAEAANAPVAIHSTPARVTQTRVGEGWKFTGARAGLYIMMKLAPETEGTDHGWVYGTLDADGSSVTSAGRVAQCMGCHEGAPHGRLFGLKDGGAPSDDEIVRDRQHRGIGTPN